MRWYLSNHSYPEMRAIESFWERHRTWWKAFGSSLNDPKMWGFLAIAFSLACLGGALNLLIDVNDLIGPHAPSAGVIANLLSIFITIGAAVALSLTWGGDIIRPHLRRVNPRCRTSCPECGHCLISQLESDRSIFQCPECGQWLNRRPFEEPFPFDVRPTPSSVALAQKAPPLDNSE